MNAKRLAIIVGIAAVVGSGVAYAALENSRQPVEFYVGHTHDHNGEAINAPAHSGGTDAYGCHNGSVPYHCH